VLHEFLTSHRPELVNRCRTKVARRRAPKASALELEHGVPLFLDQLVRTLQVEQALDPLGSQKISGTSGGERSSASEMGIAAAQHGRELLQRGFTVDQVVHSYGDICQAVTDLAFELDAPISVDEFRTLNRCLDNVIADAVTEYSYQRDSMVAGIGVQALNERLGVLAHELRNYIHTATLAVTALKTGNVAIAGATGAVLDRSLIGMRNLIDRSLADVRVTAGLPPRREIVWIAQFIAEVKNSATLEARGQECGFIVADVDAALAVEADRDMLFAALGNLLQNAFKFTHRHSEVSLLAYAAGNRVLIEVADRCGGLPSGAAATMFQPFTQAGTDKSGLGLGLSICRRSVEANNGVLSVRDVPGTGCVFTIDLPRSQLAGPA